MAAETQPTGFDILRPKRGQPCSLPRWIRYNIVGTSRSWNHLQLSGKRYDIWYIQFVIKTLLCFDINRQWAFKLQLLKTAGIDCTVYDLDDSHMLVTLQEGWRGYEARDFLVLQTPVSEVEWDQVKYPGASRKKNRRRQKQRP